MASNTQEKLAVVGIPANYRPIPFPAFWFSVDGQMVKVFNADGLRELGPGWYDTPDKTKWDLAVHISPDNPIAPIDAPALVINLAPPDDAPSFSSVKVDDVEVDPMYAAELHSRKVADIVNEIGRTEKIGLLKQILASEPRHPQYKGGRPNVMKAVNARLKFLGD
jgi:hypothetical protein